MSPNETIGIAVQGAGNVSTGHLTAYLRNPRCRVVAIGSRTKEGAAREGAGGRDRPGGRSALYDSVEALLAHPGVDALSICTPHAPPRRGRDRRRQRGQALLVEKPIAMNPAQLHAMDAAVARGRGADRLRLRPALEPDGPGDAGVDRAGACSASCSTSRPTTGTTRSNPATPARRITWPTWTPAR